MLEIGNKVEIKLMNIFGEVIEIDENSVLVKHKLLSDGVNKIINQCSKK